MIVYLLKRLLFYIESFIRTYYIEGTHFFWRTYQNILYNLEERLGVFLNIRYFWIPLWQQYSFAGYLVSIPIRILKIVGGGIIIIIISLMYSMLYCAWLILPFYLIGKMLFNF